MPYKLRKMEKVTNLNSYNAVPRKGVSWRAIFAGLVTILAVMLLLNLIGLAIGFGSIEPTEESNPLSGLGTGSLIWWIASCLIAIFLGAYVAARVGVSFSNKSGIIQGIMTWALYTFISAWLLTSAVGSIISGVGNVVGNVLSSTGQAIENQLGPVIQNQTQNLDISLEQAKQQFYSLLEDTNKQQLDPDQIEQNANEVASSAQQRGQSAAQRPGQIDSQVEQVFSNAKNQFEGTFEAVDKEALVNILVERTNMSRSEAESTVENYLSQYENLRQQAEQFAQKAEQQAAQTGEKVASAAADAALYLALALILGAIVAALGGFLGAKNLRSDYANADYLHQSYYTDNDRTRRNYTNDEYRDDDYRREDRHRGDTRKGDTHIRDTGTTDTHRTETRRDETRTRKPRRTDDDLR